LGSLPEDDTGDDGNHGTSENDDPVTAAPDIVHSDLGSLPEDGTGDDGNHGTSEKDDPVTAAPDVHSDLGSSSDDVPHTSEAGTEDPNLTVPGSGHIDGTNTQPDAESDAKHLPPGGRSFPLQPDQSSDNSASSNEISSDPNHLPENTDVQVQTEISQKTDDESTVAVSVNRNVDADEEVQSETSAEDGVTASVPASENRTASRPRVAIEHKKPTDGDDSINEPGLGSQGGDAVSSGSIGSYIVLGVIMAIILVLLGYSMFKGRGQRARETKNEDFGTEMTDVKKNLLPQNKFKGDIQPSKFHEEDETKTKLLPDAKFTEDNMKNGEAGVTVHGADSQKELGGIYDASTEKKIDFDKIETQLEPTDSPENTRNSQKQYNTNPFREAISQKKDETADNQSTHQQSPKTPAHQTAYSNVNGLPEEAVKNVPVQTQSGYFTQNSGVPAGRGGLQQQNVGTVQSPVLPMKVVTVEGCTPSRPVIVTVERNSFKY
jgi:hypothetical protein